MKKLLNATMPVLFLLSLIFSACEKTEVQKPQPAAPVPVTFTINYKWTPKAVGEKVKTGTGDIAGGETGVLYLLEPNLKGDGICCDGKWTFTPETKETDYSATQHQKTGVISFRPNRFGTYKFTIVYTCPGGAKYAQTITVTIP